MNDYVYGLKKSIPIALGYFAVSFSFGVMCKNEGISPLLSTIISATNVTSSGQYAGVKLISACASYLEIFLTVLLINLRYSLMSLSLNQKLDSSIPTKDRLLFGFGITDEVYAVAISEKRKITTKYMLGLITLPILFWTVGTLTGVLSSSIMPEKLLNALGISLYAMFIAIIIPDARRSYKVLFVILLSAAISCLFYYVPYINKIGLGFKIIISTVISAAIGALIFPIEKDIDGDIDLSSSEEIKDIKEDENDL